MPDTLLAALVSFLSMMLVAQVARADLGDDAERVVKMWSTRGARVERMVPVFLEHGHLRAIPISASVVRPLKPGAGARAAEDSGCTTVVLLGDRTAEFAVETPTSQGPLGMEKLLGRFGGGDAHGQAEDTSIKSMAGAATIARCGAARAELRRLLLDLHSPRAVLEVVVARSQGPLGELSELLPERAFGPVAPRGNPGKPVEPGPLAERLTRAEQRARVDGAARVSHVSMRAGPGGNGEFELKLSEGCHRLEVMAEVPSASSRIATDVDAEARDAEGGRVLARDRSDAPDARLDLCLGESTLVEIAFVGASGAATVTAADAVWPLAPRLPKVWGARARAGFAWAFRRRHAPDPQGEPVFETLGVQGVTSVPMRIEPGACYLAAVAVMRGEVRGLRLAAQIGERSPHDDVSERPEGAAVAFCSDTQRTALLEIEARGATPWWALSVWRLTGASP